MQRLLDILRQAYGLVVDDGTLALATVVWTAVVWLLTARAGLPPGWGAVTLFVGLALILVESAARRGRR